MQAWMAAAFASALFAGIVSVLAKCGIKTTDSDVATALRTCVVVVFTWVMVGVAGSFGQIASIAPKSWLFLALSGLATGASWICYFKALAAGDVNKVVPIDKSSTLMAVLISIALFGETNNLLLKLVGTTLATAGTFMMIERKDKGGSGTRGLDEGADDGSPVEAVAARGDDEAAAASVTHDIGLAEKSIVGTSLSREAIDRADRGISARNAGANLSRDAAGNAGHSISARDAAASFSHEAVDSASLGADARDAAKDSVTADKGPWLAYALAAAVFAALTSVLAKVGIEGVESNLATAIRTCVVLVMAWAIVAAKGKMGQVTHVKGRELGFLVASGLATGASWLFYYYAIQVGVVSVVVQIDKLSLLVSIAFARLAFKERLSPRSAAGLAMIVAGTALVAMCG